MNKDWKLETNCIQAGYTPGNGEPRMVPIIQTTTFKYDTSAHMGALFDLEASGYFYTRLARTPPTTRWPPRSAALEGGTAAMLTSSGQAANFFAIFNICSCRRPHCLLLHHLRRHLQPVRRHHEARWASSAPSWTRTAPTRSWRPPSGPTPRLVFGETIANPALTVLDIEKLRQGRPRPRRAPDRGQHLRHPGELPAL